MKTIIVVIISLTLLSACDKSKKGSWTDKDKELCIKRYSQGRITKGTEDCLCQIAENKYDNWEDAKKYFNFSGHLINCIQKEIKLKKDINTTFNE